MCQTYKTKNVEYFGLFLSHPLYVNLKIFVGMVRSLLNLSVANLYIQVCNNS